ncbi:MAG: PilZ domain-containing protein [Deltaproteobacteria bacterium]|nr:PilZ domain-containing protein [Deltaproteobacteria bacterium]
MREQRRYKRIHFERQVQMDFFTEMYNECQIKNISLSGMFVVGEFPHNVDDQCYVRLTQKGRNVHLTLEALAKVVRQEDEGIALHFTAMSFESLLSLEMILLHQAREGSAENGLKLPENLPFEINEETSRFPDKYNPFLKGNE